MLNATQRKYTDAEIMSEYEQLSKTLKELESEGKGLGGRMRENIAKILNISNGQVGKLDNIKHNAAPEVQNAVRNGEMSISTANEVAKLAPEKQKEVVEKKPSISSAEAKKMQDKKPAPSKLKEDKEQPSLAETELPTETHAEETSEERTKSKNIRCTISLTSDETEQLYAFLSDRFVVSADYDEFPNLEDVIDKIGAVLE